MFLFLVMPSYSMWPFSVITASIAQFRKKRACAAMEPTAEEFFNLTDSIEQMYKNEGINQPLHPLPVLEKISWACRNYDGKTVSGAI